MKLVGTTAAPSQFDTVVYAHCWEENGLILAHADGTISATVSGSLVWTCLNPGRRITALAAFDQCVFACFQDRTVCLFSLVTGMRVNSSKIPFEITRVTVLEGVVVCWNVHQNTILLLNRSNLESICEITADSFVVNVYEALGKVHVICTSDIYSLQTDEDAGYFLSALFHFKDAMVIDSVPFQHKIGLIMPRSWSLVSIGSSGNLEHDFEVSAPVNTLLKKAHLVSDGLAVECSSGRVIVMRNNNIQLLDPPFGDRCGQLFSTGHSMFISPDLRVRILSNATSEFEWRNYSLPLRFSEEKYLIGETDPTLTAVNGDIRGFFDGRIQNTLVFTAPVLRIDGNHAYTSKDVVALPLAPLNLIRRNETEIFDSRVSVKVKTLSQDFKSCSFLGLHDRLAGYCCLQQFRGEPYTPYIAVCLVMARCIDFEKALRSTDWTSAGISVLEDMAVTSRGSGDRETLRLIAQFLSEVWSSGRVEALLNSGSARSLKVLASVSDMLNINNDAFKRLVLSRIRSSSPAIRDAVLWIYSLHLHALKDMPLPFGCLDRAPRNKLQKFAAALLKHDKSKFLDDIEAGLRSSQASASELLLAGLDLGTFPEDEAQLVRIVKMALPAVRNRVLYAKDIFIKLLTTHRLMYHKGRQLFLVCTPADKKYAGIVFDLKHENYGDYRLIATPETLYSMNFAGAGDSVIGVGPSIKVSWKLNRGFHLFGASPVEEVAPIKFQ